MVFIVLVNFNGAEDTEACIRSLQSIPSPDFHVVVVDNGSGEDSLQVLRALREELPFTLLEAGENRGFAAGCNVGIRYALERGADQVLLLNNDTLVTPEFLLGLLSPFSKNPLCGASTCRIRFASDLGRLWYAGGSVSPWTGRTRHFSYGQEDREKPGPPSPVTFASGCCLCLSREAIEKVGLLDEDYFLYEEDTDYCLRLREAGMEIFYVPAAVILHKVSATVKRHSAQTAPYVIRSRYLLIQKRLPALRRPLAYLFCTAQCLVRCFKGEYTFAGLRRGVRSFLAGEKGKTSFS